MDEGRDATNTAAATTRHHAAGAGSVSHAPAGSGSHAPTGSGSPAHRNAATPHLYSGQAPTPPSDRVPHLYSSQALAAAQRPFYGGYSSYNPELLPKEDVDTYLQSIEHRQVGGMFPNSATLSAMNSAMTAGMNHNMSGYPPVSPAHANGYLSAAAAAGANTMYAPTSRG